MAITTNTYKNNQFIQSEKLCTLREFRAMSRFRAGQRILIGDVIKKDKEEFSTNTESFWIGEATPHHEPSANDGGFGWDSWDRNGLLDKFVLDIYIYD